jgi:drug/metabolite transporter (DMT)-like permease
LGEHFSPLNLNLYKGIVATIGLILIAVIFIDVQQPHQNDMVWLLLSGAIGIGIGDTAFFAALNRLGERSTMLLTESSAPIFTALLAMVWLTELLSLFQWLAIAVIIFGVDLVLRCKESAANGIRFSMSGLSYAGLAALCQAVGAVTGRDVLINSNIDPVSSSIIRLLGGIILVTLLIVLSRQSFKPRQVLNRVDWQYLLAATLVGTLIAMVLQMFAFTHAKAAIVQSLFTSSVIFTLAIAWLKGQFVSRNALIGSLIACFGVVLIFSV